MKENFRTKLIDIF